MTEERGEYVAVAITREEAKVWASTDVASALPERFVAPTDWRRHRHPGSPDLFEREAEHDTNVFFESVTRAVAPSTHILLVGHGRGKANAMLRLIQYWERKHPEVAHKVVGAVDSNLEALSDNEVLALAHEWYETNRDFI
ncbi:MAG: hypothetical protein HIU57_09100 [Acidobacteria bacterium]|nr:hypothetical protein [Acidobacteriota bacterium]